MNLDPADITSIAVIGVHGYEGACGVTSATLAALELGAVVSMKNRRGFGVAMHYQKLDVSFRAGTFTLEFIAPVTMDEVAVRAAVRLALKESPVALMEVREPDA